VMHLPDGVLEALLDDELDQAAATEANSHLARCTECRSRLDALRADEQLLSRSLQSLDHPAPAIAASAVISRARRSRRPLRWAAAIALLLLGAGALYARPGSPLRHWIEVLVGGRENQADGRTKRSAGIALEPGARFRIIFTAPQSPSVVTITLTDGATINARRIDGTARFTAEMDALLIEPRDAPGDFAIDLPRAAPWVEVLAGSNRILLKDGQRITTATRPDSLGRYILRLH